MIADLPALISRKRLAALAEATGDADLVCQSYEYLPLTFSRRHGDPSRPWNRFEIRVRDAEGPKLHGFQGNWRDIFQSWEALSFSFSYPDFVENIIVKLVNASTAEGYNPYRITWRIRRAFSSRTRMGRRSSKRGMRSRRPKPSRSSSARVACGESTFGRARSSSLYASSAAPACPRRVECSAHVRSAPTKAWPE